MPQIYGVQSVLGNSKWLVFYVDGLNHTYREVSARYLDEAHKIVASQLGIPYKPLG